MPDGTPPHLLPPPGLRGAVAAVWGRALEQLGERDLLDVADRDALDRYVRAQARVEALEAEHEACGSPMLARRGTGGQMPHPLVAMIERADAAAARFAADLQLTTAARLRTGYDKPAQPRLPGMPGTGAAVEAGAPPKLKVVG